MNEGSWKDVFVIGAVVTFLGGYFVWYGYALSNSDCGGCAPYIEAWWLIPLVLGLGIVVLSLVARQRSKNRRNVTAQTRER